MGLERPAGASLPERDQEALRRPPARLDDAALYALAEEVAHRTAPVFAASDWQWGQGQGMEVPDAQTIAATVLRLLKDAGEERVFDGGSVRSGRFKVTREVEWGENIEWCTVSLQVGFATAPVPVQADADDATAKTGRGSAPVTPKGRGGKQR